MKRHRGLIAIAAFLVFSVGAWLAASLMYPERTAYAGECIRRVDGALTNICEKPVVAALCREAQSATRADDPCVYQTLQPYAVFTATLETGSAGRPYTLACHAPYEPGWRRSNSNYNLFQKTCRKPDKSSGHVP